MRAVRWPLAGFLAGTLLVAYLLVAAQPSTVWSLLRRTSPAAAAGAAGLHAVLLAVRSARLRLLSRGRLSFGAAFSLFSAAQGLAAVVPWRLGELSLPALARWRGRASFAQGSFWWLAGRLLDLWALALWVAVAATVGMVPKVLVLPAFFLFVALAFLWVAAAFRAGWRLLQALAPRGRLRRGLSRLRVILLAFQRQRHALPVAASLSLAAWGAIAAFTAVLAQGMGLPLRLSQLLSALLGAAIGGALPFASVGNLGTLDAGFAAALAATGVPGQQALALAFALHFWTLALQLAFGVPCAWLLVRGRGLTAQGLWEKT